MRFRRSVLILCGLRRFGCSGLVHHVVRVPGVVSAAGCRRSSWAPWWGAPAAGGTPPVGRLCSFARVDVGGARLAVFYFFSIPLPSVCHTDPLKLVFEPLRE